MSEGDVLICIPTYNECRNIEYISGQVLRALPQAHLLIIDDNSPDGTGRIADSLAAADSRVHVLHRQTKGGLGSAYRAAYAWALAKEYRFIFEFDADGSHDSSDIGVLLEQLAKCDMVVGSRFVTGGKTGDGFLRRVVSRTGSSLAGVVLGLPVTDLTGGFLGLRREVLEAIDVTTLQAKGFAFQIELKHRVHSAGFLIVEVPISFSKRRRGESKMNFGIIVEGLRYLMRVRFKK